uniref:Disease resistance protein-like n=1 Tax=Oryza sativa subsp. japonica TaxID=39947 RepID=Q6YSB0_ORYSJ|nr:disease resistance protein-like [Oryza sativa Japonica Group]
MYIRLGPSEEGAAQGICGAAEASGPARGREVAQGRARRGLRDASRWTRSTVPGARWDPQGGDTAHAGQHGAGAGWEADDWGGSLGRFKGTRGGSRRKESAREGPTAADCGGGHRRRGKGENSLGQRESNSPGKELLHGSGNSFQATGGDELA